MSLNNILKKFGIDDYEENQFGNGLINNTWLIEAENKKFILQKINKNVFKTPEDIAHNIRSIKNYLQQKFPDYLFVAPLNTIDGKDIVFADGDYYRLFSFIQNSNNIDTVQKPQQAYEAAKQFGKFSKLLSGFDAEQLKITISDFHNLSLRYSQYKNALECGNKERIKTSEKIINFIEEQKNIVEEYEKIKADSDFKIRVTHHDTKISNVLFDNNDKGLCVIDLDTVMPGYFISDVGDMMRTYLSPANEEEKDLSKIEIREDFYEAIVNGYLSEMGEELTEKEKRYFGYAGKFMIYMQALRFITDHINNDVYYGAKYEGHNFVRTENQMVLLQRLMEKGNNLGHLQ